jgi:hypothetical protein
MTKHAIIFVSHRDAHVIAVDPGAGPEVTVATPQHVHHTHPKGESGAKEHPEDAKRFFAAVSHALAEFGQILVVGPSTAKLELIRYAHAHDHSLEARIVGVETVDHPTDGQLAAYAKHYFKIPIARTT